MYKNLLEPPEDPSGHNVILQETLKIFTPIRASRNSFGTLPKPPGPPKPQKTYRALKETPQPPVSSKSPLESSGSYKTLQEHPKIPSSHNMTLQEPPIQFTDFWLTFPPYRDRDPRTLHDLPRPSRTSHLIPRSYFFQQFKIQIRFEDISSSIALPEDFEYSFRSFLCQFSNEWCGRTIE